MPNPYRQWSNIPITYPGGSTGVARPSSSWAFYSQGNGTQSEVDKERQRIVNEKNWLAAGYNADGSKPPLMRLAENKPWNKFADNVALPMLKYGPMLEGGFSLFKLFTNPFKGLTPGEAGVLGEDLMYNHLLKKYGDGVKIARQVYIKMPGKSMYADAVVFRNRTILEIAESKFNKSIIKANSGQEMFFVDKVPGTLAGKEARSAGLLDIKVDPSKIQLTEYRWGQMVQEP